MKTYAGVLALLLTSPGLLAQIYDQQMAQARHLRETAAKYPPQCAARRADVLRLADYTECIARQNAGQGGNCGTQPDMAPLTDACKAAMAPGGSSGTDGRTGSGQVAPPTPGQNLPLTLGMAAGNLNYMGNAAQQAGMNRRGLEGSYHDMNNSNQEWVGSLPDVSVSASPVTSSAQPAPFNWSANSNQTANPNGNAEKPLTAAELKQALAEYWRDTPPPSALEDWADWKLDEIARKQNLARKLAKNHVKLPITEAESVVENFTDPKNPTISFGGRTFKLPIGDAELVHRFADPATRRRYDYIISGDPNHRSFPVEDFRTDKPLTEADAKKMLEKIKEDNGEYYKAVYGKAKFPW